MDRSVLVWAFLGVLVTIAGWGVAAGAQSPPPTPVTSWICRIPTLPTYTRCTGHAPVDLEGFWFTTGCYDSTTGRPIDCAEAWSETFSTEGVDPVWLDYWTGGHTHSRYAGDALKNLGGFWLDVLPGGIQTVLDSGEFQTRHLTVAGFVAVPEASGVDKIVIRFKAPPGWTCVENNSWVRDPADTTCRTCWGAFTVAAHVEGLEVLPDSDFYIKHSDPGDHVVEVFNGTPAMNQKLGEFALKYRNLFHDQGPSGAWVKISYNDMSLPFGGLYDINDDWDCPHVMHRLGTSVDINRACPMDKGGSTPVDVAFLRRVLQALDNALKLNEKEYSQSGKIHLDLVR